MERIQATPRPCHHHRFPISLVRRPPPPGTPPSLEQISQSQTTLMNWRCLAYQRPSRNLTLLESRPHAAGFEMRLSPPKALVVRLAEGQPVIPDVMAASTPARCRGKPKLDSARCPDGCAVCVGVCPTEAISASPLTIDLGSCV